MLPITYLKGDATDPRADGRAIVCHVCNDVGGWGKGFVMAISRRWPQAEAAYRAWHAERENNDFRLGSVQLVQVEAERWVANMIAQVGTRTKDGKPPIRYDAVAACLATLSAHAVRLGASVHMPRIGCGLAGGQWTEIEPLIEAQLLRHSLRVFVYDFEPSPPT
ncbi:MAG: macro domain-containing protein [Myxococcota bacterium]